MIHRVLSLLETLFDIARFRKGPDALPYSPVLFVFVVAGWLLAQLPVYALIEFISIESYWIDVTISLAGLLMYAAVFVTFGKRERLLQALSAVLGCAMIISLVFAAAFVFLSPFVGNDAASLIVIMIVLWSVAVDAHIVARTVDQAFHLGLLVAIGVFLVTIQLGLVLKPALPEVS